jgi:membrane protein implicated in regulation of membrane protease activity
MSDVSAPDAQTDGARQTRSVVIIIIIVGVLLALALVALAVLLAANAQTAAPSVQVVRDLLITIMALEMIVVGMAMIVLLVQVARFINLINNEFQPLITSTSDTINAVKGTAVFLGKNLTDPVINVQSTLRGVAKVAKDVEAIRAAAGIIASAAVAGSPTGAHSAASVPTDSDTAPEPQPEKAGEVKAEAGKENTVQVDSSDKSQTKGEKDNGG